jgi:hypothetical protein
MKSIKFLFVALMILSMGCKKTSNLGPEKYSFWKGDVDNFYYMLDMNDSPTQKVIGKPFMVIEYDPVSGIPLSCEFGLSEARNEYLPGAEGAIPEPFLSASAFSYANRLGLNGSVDLLMNWKDVTSDSPLSNGGHQFEVDKKADMYGQEIYHFTFGFDQMSGYIQNDNVTWGGRVSDTGAFKLIRKFNSNTISSNP